MKKNSVRKKKVVKAAAKPKAIRARKLDRAATEVISENARKSATRITSGSLQSSFHKKEREETQQVGAYEAHFPIVGIGASAGGVESFTELLANLPVDTGMAFVLVQHLSPQHDSLLPDILRRVTKMEVVRSTNDLAVEPNKVYVIPPNVNMGIINGAIKLLPRIEPAGRHMPVDFLFRCLADDQAHFAIGIVLSGADGDGGQGLKAIRAQGGITMVQDPGTAKVDSMPKNAIAAGGTDTVLPIKQLAQELVGISRHPYSRVKPEEMQSDSNDLSKVFHLLKNRAGVDFSKYKNGTVSRRLRRRILLHKAKDTKQYLEILQTDPKEVDELYADLLINVTSFFRDAEVFEVLKKKVFPKLIKRSAPDKSIRLWVPGCSTGEEAFSLAIALFETMEELSMRAPVQIFASDLSETALAKARDATYPETITTDISIERLRKFFLKTSSGYRLSQAIRECCVFATHNVTSDPPFSRMDLISCRNLLIYLRAVDQTKLMHLFAYALNPNAYLLLGNSESTNNSESFEVFDKHARIYIRKSIISRSSLDLTLPNTINKMAPIRAQAKNHDASQKLDREVNRILLERFAPVGVVVDTSAQILQFRGQTGEFLEPASGEASLNLFKMARGSLDTELRVLMKKAAKSKAPVRKQNLNPPGSGTQDVLEIEILPIHLREDGRYFLVLFSLSKIDPRKNGRKPAPLRSARPSDEVKRIREELVTNRVYLQSIIRDQDTTNEELQAANEEVLSSNEELQSTNEELETTKEELQSTNEELSTVNDELSNRNLQLTRANNDLSNLLASVSIPMIMVGNDLRIRRFTSQVEQVFNVIPTDIGRPITDIKPNFELPNFETLILEAIRAEKQSELKLQDRGGQHYSLRIRPYYAEGEKVDGAVIALIDLGPDVVGGEAPEAPPGQISPLMQIAQSTLVIDRQFRVKFLNPAFCRNFQVSAEETRDHSFFELCEGAFNIPVLKALFNDVIPKQQQIFDYQINSNFPRLGAKKLSLNARCIGRNGEKEILLIFDDVERP